MNRRSIQTGAAFTIGVLLSAYAAVLMVKHAHAARHFSALSLAREDSASQSCLAHDTSSESQGYFAGCGGFF